MNIEPELQDAVGEGDWEVLAAALAMHPDRHVRGWIIATGRQSGALESGAFVDALAWCVLDASDELAVSAAETLASADPQLAETAVADAMAATGVRGASTYRLEQLMALFDNQLRFQGS